MEEKLKVGFIPVAGEYFFKGGMFKKGSPDFRHVERSIDNMTEIIGKKNIVISNGIITSLEEANELREKFTRENIDAIVASNIMWSEDQLLLDIIREFENIPLVIWCYSPFMDIKKGLSMNEFVRATGPCGTYQSLPAIFRMGKKVKFLVGEPDERKLQKKLINFLDANLAIKKLKKSRIALIPSRWDVQTDTLIDVSLLRDIIGPEVIHFSLNDLRKVFDKISNDEVGMYHSEIKEKYKVENVRDEVLKIAIKASLAFRDFAKINEIDAISYNENNPDLHEIIGLDPCIYLEDLYKSVKVIGMEGDVINITSLLILRYLTDDGIMFSEVLTTDRKNNFFLSGHPGNHNLKNLTDSRSDIKIVPDFEWKDSESNIHGYEGAWMYFVAKEGDITLSQLLYHRCEIKMIYTRAKSLGRRIIDYYPQATIELPMSMDDFLYKAGRIGCGHHWTFSYGDLREELKDLSDILGIESVDIERVKE